MEESELLKAYENAYIEILWLIKIRAIDWKVVDEVKSTIAEMEKVIAEAKDNKQNFCDDCGSTAISFSKAYK